MPTCDVLLRHFRKIAHSHLLSTLGVTGNCAIFATKEVVSVMCTPTKGYTLAVLRHLFGGISLVNVINRFSVCVAKIPQSPV